MNSKTVRTFILFLGVLIGICMVWGFVLEDKLGTDYTFVWFFYPLVVYIPLAICTVGVLIGVVAFLLEGRQRKQVRIASFAVIGVGVFCSFAALMIMAHSTVKEEIRQKNIAAEQKYQVQNFASTPELSEDQEYSTFNFSNHIALGNRFAFHTERNYVSDDDELFSLEISAYRFENISRLQSRRICKLLIDDFFRWKARIGSYRGEKVEGEANGKEYTYYVSVHEDNRSFSYFAILVKDKDTVSLLSLRTYYTQDYSIDIEHIIEEMCAD